MKYGGEHFSETALCALLLSETAPSELKQLKEIFSSGAGRNLLWGELSSGLKKLKEALALPVYLSTDFSKTSIINYHALMRRMLFKDRSFDIPSSETGARNQELLLTYLSLRLAHIESHLMTVMLFDRTMFGFAPLAERFGYAHLASDMRDIVMRCSTMRNDRQRFEDARLLGFTDMTNAENMAANLRDLLLHGLRGFLPDGTLRSIKFRIKGLYSMFEKDRAQHLQGKSHDVIEDLIGFEIIVSDLDALWRTIKILKNTDILCAPGNEMAEKYPEIFDAIKSGIVKTEKDDITRPRKSGYSAYSLLLEYRGYPIDFKITTPERARKNEEAEAAHWRYKFLRAVEVLKSPMERMDKRFTDFNLTDEPKEDQRLIYSGGIGRGYGIVRIPSTVQYLSDLTRLKKKKFCLYEPHYDLSRDDYTITPVKTPKDLHIRDGMMLFEDQR